MVRGSRWASGHVGPIGWLLVGQLPGIRSGMASIHAVPAGLAIPFLICITVAAPACVAGPPVRLAALPGVLLDKRSGLGGHGSGHDAAPPAGARAASCWSAPRRQRQPLLFWVSKRTPYARSGRPYAGGTDVSRTLPSWLLRRCAAVISAAAAAQRPCQKLRRGGWSHPRTAPTTLPFHPDTFTHLSKPGQHP